LPVKGLGRLVRKFGHSNIAGCQESKYKKTGEPAAETVSGYTIEPIKEKSKETGMLKPQETVLAFQRAIGNKDFTAARKLVQDNLEFRGPFDTFHRADDYLHALQKLSAIVEGVDILKVFEDENDVSLFCDLKTKTVGTSFVAEWYKLKDGKIASVRVVFDARPFAAMFEKQAGLK